MLLFYIFLCFKIRTDYKVNRKRPKINLPITDCRDVSESIGPPIGWYNFEFEESIYNCEGPDDEQQISTIRFNGTGISHVKNNIFNGTPKGLIYISNANFECTMTKIYASGVASSPAQVINFQGIGSHTITGTKFSYCGVYPWKQVNVEGLELNRDNWDPTLIFISGASSNFFNNVQIKIFKGANPQGWELVPTRSIWIEGECSLNLTNSEFFNSSCYTKGSFLHLGSQKDILISNCSFEECFARDELGHAIYITQESDGSVRIEYCNFLDCGKNNHGYVVVAEVSGLTFYNNTVIFSNPANSCGCVLCYSKGQYIFENNYFTKSNQNYEYRGTTIAYEGANSNSKEENIVIDGNTFDCICGNGNGRCISAIIREGKLTVLNRNFFQNCPLGSFLIKIMEMTGIDEFHLNDCIFTNNTVDDDYGGGASIWIENGDLYDPFNFIFHGCEFKNNYSKIGGGAIQIGPDIYQIFIEVQIIGCIFQNNTSLEGCGAVKIQTIYPLEINGCTFINNKSQSGSGAIYIMTNIYINDIQMLRATITDCEFRGNSGEKAHCIYIADAPKTSIEISSCNFYNNYDENYASGSCILSNSFNITVTTCKFINDNIEQGSGGVNVTSCCILDISDCDFIHCTSGSLDKSYGGGIGYADVMRVDRDESITIRNCNFDGNGGTNGVAIYLKPEKTYPEISDIEIKNHVLSSWIFCIFFQFETDGNFELNNIDFISNSFDCVKYNETGCGTGILICESEDIEHNNAFNLVFNTCTFKNNHSPKDGGAFSCSENSSFYIEITFNNCNFENNQCEDFFGGAIKFNTNKPANLFHCTFTNNKAPKSSDTGGSGGGAVFIGSEVESVTISECTFENCFSYRGSFIFTEGVMKDINISKCTFQNLQEGQDNSVYIEVGSQMTRFVFDSNTFKDLHCIGRYGGAGLHILSNEDCTIFNCKFENCRATTTYFIAESGVIRIDETTDTNSLLIFTLCDFNNQEGSSDDSARPIYIARYSSVQLNSCRFLNYNQNTQRDGTILYSKSETSTVFYNCSFVALKGRCLIHMENAKEVDILDCQFSNCQVARSLIFADEAINFTVSNSLFSNDNDPIRFGNKVQNGLISNNTFEECSTNKIGGGSLFINGNNLNIEIKDNNFTKCTAIEGLAIYIDGNVRDADIHDCKFENNYKENSNAYTIYTKSMALNFYNCIILYTDNWQGCGISIDSPCEAEIFNVQFRNLRRPSAIKYNLGNGQITDKVTTISNCLFTGFNPTGPVSSEIQYSSFNFGPNLNIQFYNNTIGNQISNGFSNLLIGLIDKEIEKCTFINNEVIGSRGGGSGLDFTGSEVKIINCVFEENHALYHEGIGGSGGAYQFGKTASLEIDACTFINNRADLEGGAISIQCTSSYIHDSRFENNFAGQQDSTINDKMGGAIYLNNPQGSDKNKYKISNCIFSRNTGASNGHALYIEGSNTYACICDLCLFEDNSRNNNGSQILIDQNAHLDFSNSTVCLNDFNSKSRGIELFDGVLNVYSVVFSNIEASIENDLIEGNAILVNRGNSIASIEDNLFKNCYVTRRISFSVTFNGKELNFLRNTFDFSSNKGCGCLRIYTTGNINVEDNIFQNAYLPISNFHGVFVYEEKERNTLNKHTVIRNNTFQNCTSRQTSCFQFKWISNDYEFVGNTFQNNDLLNYLGEFDFMGKKINGEFYFGRNKFINNTARSLYGGGSALWFQNKEKEILLENRFTLILDECQFIGNHAINCSSDSRGYKNGNGGAIQFGWTETMSNINLEIRDSMFINNIADNQGGALSIKIIGYTIIDNCTFKGNKAGNEQSELNQVYGGAIHTWQGFSYAGKSYLLSLDNNKTEIFEIYNTTFKSNSAFDGCAIYIEGEDPGTKFVISQNTFIDNYYEDENQNSRKKGIITSKILDLYDGRIEKENEFIKDDPLLVNVLYIYPPTNIFTKSDTFTKSDIFTQSGIFSKSDIFTQSRTFATTIHLKSAKKLTQSISLSITYTQYKSVSYSISHFESETYLMSYNSEEGTYLLVLTQSNYYNYFPYIIYYLTPLYVETFVPIIISKKQVISKEQLIGVVCGSVSVFFLILGIIILVIQKKQQEKLKYEEFDDFTESSDPIIKKVETKMGNKETEAIDTNVDSFESDGLSWL